MKNVVNGVWRAPYIYWKGRRKLFRKSGKDSTSVVKGEQTCCCLDMKGTACWFQPILWPIKLMYLAWCRFSQIWPSKRLYFFAFYRDPDFFCSIFGLQKSSIIFLMAINLSGETKWCTFLIYSLNLRLILNVYAPILKHSS